jgi:hypothetical protein
MVKLTGDAPWKLTAGDAWCGSSLLLDAPWKLVKLPNNKWNITNS